MLLGSIPSTPPHTHTKQSKKPKNKNSSLWAEITKDCFYCHPLPSLGVFRVNKPIPVMEHGCFLEVTKVLIKMFKIAGRGGARL